VVHTFILSRFCRILLACLCGITLCTVFFTASSRAYASSTTPPSGSFDLQCGAERHNPSNFTVHTGGGYCGNFSYVLTPTSAYAIWPQGYTNNGDATIYLHVWAYIPTVDAGATVHYAALWCSTDGQWHDLINGSSQNQNNLSYWNDVGKVGIGQDNGICGIKIYSTLSDHMYMAEDALTFTTSFS